jgi:hypothetical protein
MFDYCALALAAVLVAFACNPRWELRLGKFRTVTVSGSQKFALVFPLGSTISIIAILRLIGRFDPSLCGTCSRITYDLVWMPYVGWVLAFIGLSGLRSFSVVKGRGSKSLVVLAVVCGPLLVGVGFFEILLRLRA